MRLVSSEHRSQLRNREAVTERLVAVVAEGLRIPKPRRATRPTQASKVRRLGEKKRRGAIKRERRRPEDGE